MTTTPNFEELQSFSKHQLEALTAASTTWTKGMQELAAEFDRLYQEDVRRQFRSVRKAARRSQRRGSCADLERVRQAGLRGLRGPGEQVLRALCEGGFRCVEAGHVRLRESSGEVVARGRHGPFLRSELRAGVLRETPVYFFLEPFASATGDGGHAGAGNRP